MELLVVVGVIVLFVIVLIVKGMVIVRQAEVMVIERLGKFNRVLSSGINIIWPFIEKPRKFLMKKYVAKGRAITMYTDRIDLRETVYDFPPQNVITKDNVMIEINGLLYFQITDPIKAVYEINNLPDAIEKLTQTTLRSIIGEMELDETLSSREEINAKLRTILDEATDKWGVKVNRVEIQDIIPPQDIRTAMEKQMKAERDRRAKILEAEGTKRKLILEAEGEMEAKIKRAEGEANAKLKIAEAESKSIEFIAKVLQKHQTDPGQYLIAIKFIEAFKEIINSPQQQKIFFIPYDLSGLLSSIGTIKELFDKR